MIRKRQKASYEKLLVIIASCAGGKVIMEFSSRVTDEKDVTMGLYIFQKKLGEVKQQRH